VIPCALHRRWEGEVRPGHFAGVLTVVAKLFNIVQPDVAVFGQKDVQQATLVRAMVEDLAFATEIVVAPTTREGDGLAMSSRNSYLSAEDRARATVLSRALFAARDAYRAGERRAEPLVSRARAVLDTEPSVRIDYLALADGATLEPLETADDRTVAMIAARVGKTRLIDNLVLGA
jgi:pantoate--beta-alanine ligase